MPFNADYEVRESVQLDGSVFKPYQLAGRATAGRSRLAAPFATSEDEVSASASGGSGRMPLADQMRSTFGPIAGTSRASASEPPAQLVPRIPIDAQMPSRMDSQTQSNQSFKRPPSGRLTPAPGTGALRRANPTPPNAAAPTPQGLSTYRVTRQQSEDRSARPESRGSTSGVGVGRGRGRPDSASRFSSSNNPSGGRASSLSRPSDGLPTGSLFNGAFPLANGSRGANARAEPPLQTRGAPPQSYNDLFGAPLDAQTAIRNGHNIADRNRCVNCPHVSICGTQILMLYRQQQCCSLCRIRNNSI